MDEGKVAHVGFDQLEHADVGRDPRQDAETGDEHELLDIARRGSVVGGLWGARQQAKPHGTRE